MQAFANAIRYANSIETVTGNNNAMVFVRSTNEGSLLSVSELANNDRHGLSISYRDTGSMDTAKVYSNGRIIKSVTFHHHTNKVASYYNALEGLRITYDENGNLETAGRVKGDYYHGEFKTFGALPCTIVLENGSDTLPDTFPSGEQALFAVITQK